MKISLMSSQEGITGEQTVISSGSHRQLIPKMQKTQMKILYVSTNECETRIKYGCHR